MANLKDVMAYFLAEYPLKDELSNARLTKMVYLADWKSAIERGKTITDIKWFFDNHGPFVWDIKNTAAQNSDLFTVRSTRNVYGGKKDVLELVDEGYEPRLSSRERGYLDHVIEQTKPLLWADFIRLVYSTYPVASSDRYETLDLAAKAKEYQKAKPLKLARSFEKGK
jgi:hypothetical protein